MIKATFLLGLLAVSSAAVAATGRVAGTAETSVTILPKSGMLAITPASGVGFVTSKSLSPLSSASGNVTTGGSGNTFKLLASFDVLAKANDLPPSNPAARGFASITMNVAPQPLFTVTNTGSSTATFTYRYGAKYNASLTYQPNVLNPMVSPGYPAHPYGSASLTVTPLGYASRSLSAVAYGYADSYQRYAGYVVSLGAGDSVAFGGSGSFVSTSEVNGVPEPAEWAMLISGLGLAGSAARRRRVATKIPV
jgi:hypothetical protein